MLTPRKNRTSKNACFNNRIIKNFVYILTNSCILTRGSWSIFQMNIFTWNTITFGSFFPLFCGEIDFLTPLFYVRQSERSRAERPNLIQCILSLAVKSNANDFSKAWVYCRRKAREIRVSDHRALHGMGHQIGCLGFNHQQCPEWNGIH